MRAPARTSRLRPRARLGCPEDARRLRTLEGGARRRREGKTRRGRSRRLAAVRISNASVADDFADAVVYRLPMLDETQQDEMVSAFLAEVTADHVRASASALLASRVKLGAVAGASEKTSKASLRAAWTKGRRLARKALDRGEGGPCRSISRRPPVPSRPKRRFCRRPRARAAPVDSEFANGLKLVIIEDPSLTGRTTLNLEACGRHVRGRSRPSRRARRTHAADEVRDRLSYGRRHPPCCKGTQRSR